jgi:hypothetical protein
VVTFVVFSNSRRRNKNFRGVKRMSQSPKDLKSSSIFKNDFKNYLISRYVFLVLTLS